MSQSSSSSHASQQEPLTVEDQQEFQNLPTLLTQWKRIQEEKRKLVEQMRVLKEQISGNNMQCSVMETMIMGTMKKHSLGAIDLKSSGARVVYKKRSTKAPISKKDMEKHLTEHLKSQEAAKTLMDFLATKRETKVKEALVYEKNEVAEAT
jgi:hypothetical protein